MQAISQVYVIINKTRKKTENFHIELVLTSEDTVEKVLFCIFA